MPAFDQYREEFRKGFAEPEQPPVPVPAGVQLVRDKRGRVVDAKRPGWDVVRAWTGTELQQMADLWDWIASEARKITH